MDKIVKDIIFKNTILHDNDGAAGAVGAAGAAGADADDDDDDDDDFHYDYYYDEE